MLIGIDASRANRDHKSGTEWYSYYVIRWLAKLDKKNQYILYSDKPLKGGLLDLTSPQYFVDCADKEEIKFDEKGCQIIRSPFHNFKAKILGWPFNFFWTLGRLSLEMLVKKPDVLFVPAHGLPMLFPKKTIITIHDIAFERNRCLYQANSLGPERRFWRKALCFLVRMLTLDKYEANSTDYLRWSTRFSLQHAKKIITVSNFSKKEILRMYKADGTKIKVIYNGYNSLLYKKINDEEKIKEVLDKYGIERPYIFYVGRLEKKKNIPALVEAFCLMRGNNKNIKHKLVLIGDAGFGYDEIKYIIREFGFDSEVIMTGWVQEEDLPYIYNGATAFIFPSKYEGFGIPLLQAMSCEVPSAVSSISVLKEVAGGAVLFFDPNDLRSIESAMKNIIADDKLRNSLVARGKERVKGFNWKKCTEETLKEINSL